HFRTLHGLFSKLPIAVDPGDRYYTWIARRLLHTIMTTAVTCTGYKNNVTRKGMFDLPAYTGHHAGEVDYLSVTGRCPCKSTLGVVVIALLLRTPRSGTHWQDLGLWR